MIQEMSETELLGLLSQQREDSVGFDNDKTITDDRARALDYYKGEHAGHVKTDLPSGENRSKYVSTDVADQIETMLPDLIEVFMGGDDVVTFRAEGEEDEQAARQETDYIRHVFMAENDGFGLLYEGFKDALLSKLGVWHFYWDSTPDYIEYDSELYEYELDSLKQQGVEIVEAEPLGPDETGVNRFRVLAQKVRRNGRAVIEVVEPENFTVSPHTKRLKDTDYCAMRSRVTVQSLLEDGYDPNLVETLRDEEVHDSERTSRDLNEENVSATDAAIGGLRLVEVVVHYVRVDLDGDGKPQIWRIVTGNGESVILDKEKRPAIEFAAVTPFPMPHRLIGQSLADKAIPVQRWKSSITRMMNDSGTNANNQRVEVSLSEIIDGVTLQQVVDNQPGGYVVTKSGAGIRPLQTTPPAFDFMGALEYADTVLERRTGVVRNAQGLNPDTLHDTKGGAEVLMSAAQKRVRLMARIFAEGGIRDLFLGLHDLLRSNSTIVDTQRLRNEWVSIEPSNWARRKDMSIDIGIGSGGRDDEIKVVERAAAFIEGLIQKQGGLSGPFVTPENVYALANQFLGKIGLKSPERFVSNPAAQEGAPQQPPPPNPELVKVQAGIERDKAELQIKAQGQQIKAQTDQHAAQLKAESDAEIARERLANEMSLAREKVAAEIALAREKMQMEIQLAREKVLLEVRANARLPASDEAEVDLSANRPGGSLSE